MNEGEFSGGPVQSNHEEQGNFASQEPTTPEQSADTANQVMFSSADATASRSGKSVFDNSNSFDRPQGAISSDTGDSNGDEPEHNFSFGGRSRRGGTGRRNFDAEPQNTFTPNPNAPAFFNDAMASMTPVEQPKSNKNFLKIGIIAAVAILVVGGGILAAVLAGRGGGSGGGNDVKLDEKKVAELEELLDSADEDVTALEDIIRVGMEQGVILTDYKNQERYETYMKDIDSAISSVKTFNESLQNYKTKFKVTRNMIDIDKNIDELKKLMDSRISYYEKIPTMEEAVYAAVNKKEGESAKDILKSKVGDNKLDGIGKLLDDYDTTINSLTSQYQSNNCASNIGSEICVSLSDQAEAATAKLNDPSLTKSSLEDYFSGFKYSDNNSPMTLMSNIKEAVRQVSEGEDVI